MAISHRKGGNLFEDFTMKVQPEKAFINSENLQSAIHRQQRRVCPYPARILKTG